MPSKRKQPKSDVWLWVDQVNSEIDIQTEHVEFVYGLIKFLTQGDTDSDSVPHVENDAVEINHGETLGIPTNNKTKAEPSSVQSKNIENQVVHKSVKSPTIRLTDMFKKMAKAKEEALRQTGTCSVTSNDQQLTLHNDCTSCRLSENAHNCPLNPYCLHKLGFEKLSEEPVKVAETEDANDEYRSLNEPAGLRNLGATCYVNTYLQLWFHNIPFRNSIYRTEIEDSNDAAAILASTLQYIFANMQLSLRTCIDPSPLIQSLGLHTDVQQDATEFSKLLLDKLSNRVVRNMFTAVYEQIIRCSGCNAESKRLTPYSELELSTEGITSLKQGLDKFLEHEKLEGDNQYDCSQCSRKCDATKFVQLKSLPDVLNIQLLRFIYDRKTLRRKKLTHAVSFPDRLDLKPSSTPSSEDSSSSTSTEETRYDLAAVLMHNGGTADRGHYTAHIRLADNVIVKGGNDSARAKPRLVWYSFNDDVVEQLDLEDGNVMKDIKKQRTKEAYMLVYHKVSRSKDIRESEAAAIPDHLNVMITEENIQIEDQMELNTLEQVAVQQQADETKADLLDIWKDLPVTDKGDNFYFIPVAWLEAALSSENSEVSKFNTDNLLCAHGKLNWTAYGKYKAVSHAQGESLYSRYASSETVRLTRQDSLCWECVRAQYRLRKLRALVDSDSKLITQLLSAKSEEQDNGNAQSIQYWMDKSELKHWKSARLNRVEQETRALTFTEDTRSRENSADENFNAEAKFNQAILCPHGGLNTNERTRQLVPQPVWEILAKHFPKAVEFTSCVSPCSWCKERENMEMIQEEKQKNFIKLNKKVLGDFSVGSSRPDPENLPCDSTVYLMSQSSYQSIKTILVKNSSLPFACIENRSLLCSHEKLQYLPTDKNNVVLLSRREWDILVGHLVYDTKITLTPVPLANGSLEHCEGETNLTPYTTQPEICRECLAERQEQAKQESHRFTQAQIFVQLLEDSGTSEQSAAKRRRVETIASNTLVVPTLQPANRLAPVRRTTRRMAVPRGSRSVTVSSNETLQQLKIKLLEIFEVAPFDQILKLGDIKLDDVESTLEHLKLYPNCCLTLECEAREEQLEESGVEGFTGTSLLST